MAEQTATTAPPERPKVGGLRQPLGRLLVMFGPASLSISLIWGAVPSILLALQVQRLVGEDHKVATLALVTTCGAATSMVVQPIGGLISDRTRSRWGRRAPWMVFGVLAGGLALVGMAFAGSVATFIVAWVTVQLGLNLAWAPLTAVLPDRVPRGLRATFASVWGLGAVLGSIGGQVYGAAFAHAIPAGYLVLAGVAVVVVTLFVVLCPDASSLDAPHRKLDLRGVLSAFWVNPVSHPDFAWAFVSRMCAYGGYYIVFGFKLYILQDYIGLGEGAVAAVAKVGVVTAGGVFVATMVAGRLSDRVGRRKVFVVVAAVLVGGAVLVPLAVPTLGGMLILAACAGLGFGCFQAVDTALVSEVLPSEDGHAKDLGLINIAGQLPAVLAPGVAGAVVLLAGGYAALFPVGACLAAVSALTVLPIKAVR